MRWASHPLMRDQLVLFTRTIDDVIPQDHLVRIVDLILRDVQWDAFEAEYNGEFGAKAVHPRIIAAVCVYGIQSRVRSSRQLEEALKLRADFMWLAEGHQLDHTTIHNFRTKFDEHLANVSTQFAIRLCQMKVTSLKDFGFDGTRLFANNARQRTIDVTKIDEVEQKLQQQFLQLQQECLALDAQDDREQSAAHQRLPKELAKVENQLAAVQKSKAEYERAKGAKEALPKRIPLTDPTARVTPNKHGGFDPNYTPIDRPPEWIRRPDGSVPIPAEQHSQLPTEVLRKAQKDQPEQHQLSKLAFQYDIDADCFWCPQGKALPYRHQTSETLAGTHREVVKRRYKSDAADCAECPLRALCLSGKAEVRTLTRDQYEDSRDKLRERMSTDESKAKLRRRQTEGERPFAVIKHQFGAYEFLSRGLENVKGEWSWLVTAANVLVMVRWYRLMGKSKTSSSPSPRERATGSKPNVASRAKAVNKTTSDVPATKQQQGELILYP